jgi:hypothetical protein
MTLQNFNINSYVRVRLTDLGRAELRRQHDELNRHISEFGGKPLGQSFTEVDGWSKWQLWDLMQRLGPLVLMGYEPPFDTNIVLEIDDAAHAAAVDKGSSRP